ncbi:MAG: lysostaphin resistance A-like protein, partial [Acidimicrobiales bacterium]
MGDILLLLPIMAVVLLLSGILLAVGALADGTALEDLGDSTADLPAWLIVVPTMIQQLAWFGWPFIVSKWKGLGPASDWGWAFKPVDLGIGLGTAMIAMFAAGLAATVTGALVGLDDESQAENTQIITDLEGSPWLYGLLFVVIIGAPVSEEILFRGLIMRAVEKRWGTVAGVIGSLLVFVPIHFADGGIITDGAPAITDGQIVLWATIAALGLVLAVVTVVTDRL